MLPSVYIGEGGKIQSGDDVCGSVCDSVRDNSRISGKRLKLESNLR